MSRRGTSRCLLLVAALTLAVSPCGHAADDASLWAAVEAFREVADSLAPGYTAEDSVRLLVPLERLGVIESSLENASFSAVGRSREKDYSGELLARAAADVDTLRVWWSEGGSRRAEEAFGPDFDRVDNPVEVYKDERLHESMAALSHRLERFEVKYGEGSPRLNIAEVAINYSLQTRGWFAPNESGPSPNEIIFAYAPGYVTVEDGNARAVSVFEVGWRRFFLDHDPDAAEGIDAMLRPRYAAIGVGFADERNGTLRWPFSSGIDGRTRIGPFVSWGDLKAALLLQREGKGTFVITRQVQFLPNLF